MSKPENDKPKGRASKPSPVQDVFNTAEAAEYLRVSRSAFYTWWQHLIPVSMLPGPSGKPVKRYLKSTLNQFLKDHEVQPGDPRHPGCPLFKDNLLTFVNRVD